MSHVNVLLEWNVCWIDYGYFIISDIQYLIIGDDVLNLTFLDGTSAWSAKLQEKACKDRTQSVLGDIWDMAREAFSSGVNLDKYDFVIKEENLLWRKVGGKAKIKIMEIPLEPVNFLAAQNKMFAQLVESNAELKCKNKEFQRRQENLVRDFKKVKGYAS